MAAERERATPAAERRRQVRRRATERHARLWERLTFTAPAIPARLGTPRLVTEPGPLASTEARLAGLALLVAAAGSLGLIRELRRGTLG